MCKFVKDSYIVEVVTMLHVPHAAPSGRSPSTLSTPLTAGSMSSARDWDGRTFMLKGEAVCKTYSHPDTAPSKLYGDGRGSGQGMRRRNRQGHDGWL